METAMKFFRPRSLVIRRRCFVFSFFFAASNVALADPADPELPLLDLRGQLARGCHWPTDRRFRGNRTDAPVWNGNRISHG